MPSMYVRLGSILLVSVMFGGCAHHKDVRPGADGVHRVTVEEEEEEDASRDAIKQARHYCESIEKQMGVIDEKSTYIGSMDEKTRKTLKQVSQAATFAGGAVSGAGFVSGDRTAQGVGSAVQVGGVSGQIVTGGKNYRFELRFRCQ